MVGVICTWDILSHPVVTIQCFGWRVFWKAVLAGQRRTFLSMIRQNESSGTPTSAMPLPLERCIHVELRAKRIYLALARAFVGKRSAARFFTDLAEQEQDHADLLAMCWATVRRGGWKAEHFDPWQEYLAPLETQMQMAESAVDSANCLDKAFRLVMEIESSEINRVFLAAVAASESAFVKKLKPFQDAIETHISYIVMQLSRLAPQSRMASRELWAKFPQMS